jgi:hypothetical protein
MSAGVRQLLALITCEPRRISLGGTPDRDTVATHHRGDSAESLLSIRAAAEVSFASNQSPGSRQIQYKKDTRSKEI